MADARPTRRRYDLALWIDRRIGPVLCAAMLAVKRLVHRRRPAPAPDAVERVLLLKMWGMGSIVLATPLLERLRARHPRARIDLVTLRENAAIARLFPAIERVETIDLRAGYLRFFVETARTLWRLRRERYDLLLDLEFFTRFSAIFSFLAGPLRSHGFSAKGNWRGKLHDVEVPFNAYNHVTQNFLTLLQGDPMKPADAEALAGPEVLPRLEADPGAWERCRRALEGHPAWRAGAPIVVVNPNAGDFAIERRWPEDRVAELLRHLCAHGEANVVTIGAPAEREHVESVVQAAGAEGRVIDLSGRTSLEELVALLAHAEVVVTNDSGPLHMASAAGASTVALFGPETPTLYGPLTSRPGQRHIVHYLKLACSPCMFVHDNKVLSCWFAQARCMTGITPAGVIASVEELLAANAEQPAPRLRVIDS